MIQKFTTLRGMFALGLLALMLLGTSCGSPKRYAYLQNVELAKLYTIEHENKILVRPGDRLRIIVQSSYPELLRPFVGVGYPNVRSSVNNVITDNQQNTNSNNYARAELYGYEVDAEGQINFPMLGYVKVGGLNREGVAKLIERKIKDGKFLPDPKVDVMYSNFKIYLMGAAVRPESVERNVDLGASRQYASFLPEFTPVNSIGGGILRLSDKDELNILEAIAYLGEMPMNANIEKVNVIRRINGKFVTYRLNLKSADVFQSPGFYLKQDDIVYIEQLYRRSESEALDRILQYSTPLLTTIASLITTLLLIRKY